MRQIVDDEHLRVYGIITRHIKLVAVRRLLLLMDDVLTGWRFRQREYLQVVLGLNLHGQDHVPHEVDQPRWDFILHATCQEFLIFERVSSPFKQNRPQGITLWPS